MISECLDCIVGSTHVAVPVERVERLIEYPVGAPPPLAQPWIGGIGLLGPELFVSIRLRGERDTRARREAKGLLLRAKPGEPRLGLEVDRILGIEELAIDDDETPSVVTAESVPAGWLIEAARADGRKMAWLDVAAVLESLAGDAPRTTGAAR